jgi:hypothetical protein
MATCAGKIIYANYLENIVSGENWGRDLRKSCPFA